MSKEKKTNQRLDDFKKRVEELRSEYKTDKEGLINKLKSMSNKTEPLKSVEFDPKKIELTSENNPFSKEEMIKRYKELKK